MDNKIYITNFWHTRNNYGANLTAFALQNVLQQLGFDNKLINNPIYTNEIMLKKCFGFQFQQQHLKTTQKIDKNADILNSDCEIFITGSDQVFRPIYTQKKLDQYLLDFANKVCELLKNEDLRNKYSNLAREFCINNFSWSSNTNKISKVFEDMFISKKWR